MEHPINRFIENAKEVRLAGGAAAHMRERLIAHMRAHPAAATPSSIPSPFLSWLYRPVVALPLLLLALAGGGSAYAAAGALPGDILYPVKVGVVEPVKGLLALSSRSNAEWKASLAETRLTEVETLATERGLTPEERASGEERLDASLAKAKDTIAKLAEEDPAAATKLDDSLAAALDKHEKAFSALGDATTSARGEEARAFAKHLREKLGHDGSEATTSTKTDPGASKSGEKIERAPAGATRPPAVGGEREREIEWIED